MGSMSLPQAFVICQVPEKNLLAWNTKGHVFKNTIILQWWNWWYFSFAVVIFQFYIVTVSVSCALLCMFVHFIWLSLWIAQRNELVCVFTLSKAIPPEEAKATNWQGALFSKMQKYCWFEQVFTCKLNLMLLQNTALCSMWWYQLCCNKSS